MRQTVVQDVYAHGRGYAARLRAPTAGWGWRVALVAPLIGVGLALSAGFCVAALRALGLSWPITFPEGAQLAAVLRVRDGESLYVDFRQFPYLITPYPPVLYLAGGLLSRVLDLSVPATLMATRGITLLASLAAAGLIFALARAAGAARLGALAGAGLFLPLPLLDKWGYAIRPDLPALALSLLAALLLLRRPEQVAPAAAVAALAFLTKQTMIALPVAAVIWLWWEGRRAGAGRFAGTWLGLVLGSFLLLHLLTDGRHELNVVLAQLNPTNGLEVTLRGFLPLPNQAWLPVGLAMGALMSEMLRRRRLGLLGCYWLVALGVALFTLRGRGSNVNYLIESAALACALAAVAVDQLGRRLDSTPRLGRLGVTLLTAATLIWGVQTGQYWRERGGVDPGQRAPIQEIVEAQSVIAEESLFVVLAGKPVLLSDPFQLSQLTSAGRWDPADLIQRIKRDEFDLIVLQGDVRQPRFAKRQPFWPEAVRQAIKDQYVPAGRVGIFWLYKPER